VEPYNYGFANFFYRSNVQVLGMFSCHAYTLFGWFAIYRDCHCLWAKVGVDWWKMIGLFGSLMVLNYKRS
jgi:hypothetical protein